MKYLSSLFMATFALVGCSGLKVTKPSAEGFTKDGEVDGLPFYIKVPICVHETKWLERQLIATIKYPERGPGGNSVDAERSIVIADSPDAIAQLKKLLEGDSSSSKTASATDIVTRAADQFKRGMPNTNPVPDIQPLSNGWETKMVTGTQPYYVNSKAPLFGSSNTSFKFNDDGALTEATSNVSDDTAKTLLGLLPIADKLAIRWGTARDPRAEAKSSLGLWEGNEGGKQTGKAQTRPRFEVTFKPLVTIVTVRHVSKEGAFQTSICGAMHAMSDKGVSGAQSTKDGKAKTDEHNQNVLYVESPFVQVARETLSDGAKKDTDDSAPAYKINGSIQLPKSK